MTGFFAGTLLEAFFLIAVFFFFFDREGFVLRRVVVSFFDFPIFGLVLVAVVAVVNDRVPGNAILAYPLIAGRKCTVELKVGWMRTFDKAKLTLRASNLPANRVDIDMVVVLELKQVNKY